MALLFLLAGNSSQFNCFSFEAITKKCQSQKVAINAKHVMNLFQSFLFYFICDLVENTHRLQNVENVRFYFLIFKLFYLSGQKLEGFEKCIQVKYHIVTEVERECK